MEIERWRHFDYALLGSILLLSGFGVAMIASATRGTSLGGFSWSALPVRQAIYLAVGLLGMGVLSQIDYRHLQALRWPLYLMNLLLLVLVLAIGKRAYGAVRWIDLGVFDLQPSELAKPLLVIALAGFLGRREEHRDSLSTFLLSLLLVLLPVGLVFIQPDLSTAVVLLVIWLGMVWASGTRPAYLVALLFLSIPVGVLAWHYVLEDYQKARLLLFLDPYQDLWGGGYNIIQAWTAIGSGGWLGKGYGQGTQSQLHFLPVRHSDFIFAVICEEFGFLPLADPAGSRAGDGHHRAAHRDRHRGRPGVPGPGQRGDEPGHHAGDWPAPSPDQLWGEFPPGYAPFLGDRRKRERPPEAFLFRALGVA